MVTAETPKDEVRKIKDDADGLAFRAILNVLRRFKVGALIYTSEGKGRDGVDESFVGGDFTGVEGGFARLITRWMHRLGIVSFFGFMALVMSMDVIEGTTATVTNRPVLSGGTSVVIGGPGAKRLGQAPDIYADLVMSHVPENQVKNFEESPLNFQDGIMTNLQRIATVNGKTMAELEVVILGRGRERSRLRQMLPNVPEAEIDEATKADKTQQQYVLTDPNTGLTVRVIPDGTFLPAVKAGLGGQITPGKHLVFYGSSGSPEAMLDLQMLAGFQKQGAVASMRLMPKGVKDVEAWTGTDVWTSQEIEGKPDEPGVKQLRPKDWEAVLAGRRLVTLADARGDIDVSITFITDNPVWGQQGLQLDGQRWTRTTTLRVRTIKGHPDVWFEHQRTTLSEAGHPLQEGRFSGLWRTLGWTAAAIALPVIGLPFLSLISTVGAAFGAVDPVTSVGMVAGLAAMVSSGD